MWIALAVAALSWVGRAGVSLAAVGLVPPPMWAASVAALVVLAFAAATRPVSTRSASVPGPTEHGFVLLPHTYRERLFMALVIAPSAAVCEEFAFHHGGTHQGIVPFLSRAGIGLVFGLIVLHTGTLVGVIALHYAVDAALAIRPSRAPVAAPAA